MQIWRSLDEVPADLARTAVVIGNFDGVHRGHQARDRPGPRGRRRARADRRRGHLRPAPDGGAAPRARAVHADLDRGARRAARPRPGWTPCSRCRSTATWPSWSPEEFVDRVLVDALHAAAVVVGANFRFGSRGRRRRGDAARGGGVARLRRPRASPLDGGPQVWSSTYVRTCLADRRRRRRRRGAGPAVHGPRRGRRAATSAAASSASRPPTCRPAPCPRAPADGVYAGWLRRLDTGETCPGRDQRRHQPDLRRRARAPGGELRPRPRRPRAVRRRGRGGVRRPAARHGRVRVGRDAGRADARRRRPGPRAAGADDATASRWRRPRPGSCRTGCPTSSPRSGRAARAALRPRRTGAAAGPARCWSRRPPARLLGWRVATSQLRRPGRAGSRSRVLARALVRAHRAARPADRRAGRCAARSAACACCCRWRRRALPLLLLFVTFLFINTEVWQVAASLDGRRAVAGGAAVRGAGGRLPAGAAARGGGPGRRRRRRRLRCVARPAPAPRWSRRAASWRSTTRRRPGGVRRGDRLRALEPDPGAARHPGGAGAAAGASRSSCSSCSSARWSWSRGRRWHGPA